MKTKTHALLVFILVIVMACGFASAARTLPPSNETSSLTVSTSAAAVGGLSAHTDIVYVQGNGDLTNNPPLDPDGEGQSTISYQEDTMAVSGAVTYDKWTKLDTGPQTANGANFETDKLMSYDSDADGTENGQMISEESILVEVVATGNTTAAACPMGSPSGMAVLPATNDVVIAGSEMVVSEAAVASSSSALITSDSCSTPVEMDYSVDIQGVNQTPGDPTTGAEGSATAYVSANLQEGNGDGTDMGTEVSYSDVTSASGLFELAKDVSYSSS